MAASAIRYAAWGAAIGIALCIVCAGCIVLTPSLPPFSLLESNGWLSYENAEGIRDGAMTVLFYPIIVAVQLAPCVAEVYPPLAWLLSGIVWIAALSILGVAVGIGVAGLRGRHG